MRVAVLPVLCVVGALLHCQTPIERAHEYKFDPCPGLGMLTTFPEDATYTTDEGKEMLVVRDRSGQTIEIEKSKVLNATQITTRERLDEFLGIYERVCGSRPPYYNEITWVREDQKRQDEEARLKREEAARLKREEGERLASRLRVLKREHSDTIQAREEKRQRLSETKREVSRQQPESFMITGRLTGRDSSGVFFFGNAVPSGGSLVSPGAMLLNKGAGFLKAPREEDILLGQQILAREVFYHGEGKARTPSGGIVTVNLYGYEAEEKAAARFNELKRQANELESALRSLDDQLQELDELERKLKTSWPEIRISE